MVCRQKSNLGIKGIKYDLIKVLRLMRRVVFYQ